MICEIPEEADDDVSVVTQNIDLDENILDNVNIERRQDSTNLHRGFNRFRDFGIEMNDIHMMRLVFHTSYISQHRRGKFKNNFRNKHHRLVSECGSKP